MDISRVAHKARQFRDLHRPGQPLVLFNVWDAVSARVVEQAGYPALATGSAAVAWTQGFPDGEHISRNQMLQAVSRIARAVAVPVSADLEAAYGLTVRDAAATARGAIEAGAAGLNFEDTGEPGKLIDLDLQCERIEAMVETGARLGVPLVINARTDVFIAGGAADTQTRMEEAIRRGNRFLQAGADCVFVLGVSDEESDCAPRARNQGTAQRVRDGENTAGFAAGATWRRARQYRSCGPRARTRARPASRAAAARGRHVRVCGGPYFRRRTQRLICAKGLTGSRTRSGVENAPLCV